MNEESVLREGRISIKRKEMDKLTVRIDSHVKIIRYALFVEEGVKSLNMAEAETAFDDLKADVKHWLELNRQLAKLEA